MFQLLPLADFCAPNRLGAYFFSRSTLPLLVSTANTNPKYPPTLVFTGATASLRGSTFTSSFATGKFALRALTQSLGKEFGPQGVHVAHAIIDGVIDIPRTKGYVMEKEDAKINSDAVSFSFSTFVLIEEKEGEEKEKWKEKLIWNN